MQLHQQARQLVLTVLQAVVAWFTGHNCELLAAAQLSSDMASHCICQDKQAFRVGAVCMHMQCVPSV